MTKLTNYTYLLLCTALTLFDIHNSNADSGKNISKLYRITQPDGQNINFKTKLTEASALALSHNNKSLWTVSDNNKKLVFKMTLQGDSKETESFAIVNNPYARADLEGICLSGNGHYMYLAQERELAIIKVKLFPTMSNAEMTENKPLSLMENYSTKVQPYLGNHRNDNTGLEGITFHTGTDHIYVLIEKVQQDQSKGPLIIKINNEMTSIIESKFLSSESGFVGADGEMNIDGSGIDFDQTDPSKNHFHIVSDKGRRLFYYDWDQNKATPVRDLNYDNAEGVAYDPTTKKIYIVTDGGHKADSKLYTYTKQ